MKALNFKQCVQWLQWKTFRKESPLLLETFCPSKAHQSIKQWPLIEERERKKLILAMMKNMYQCDRVADCAAKLCMRKCGKLSSGQFHRFCADSGWTSAEALWKLQRKA